MKCSTILIVLVFIITCNTSFAQSISEGANVLFKGTTSKLTPAEKNAIYKSLGFSLYNDKKQFLDASDETKGFPFPAVVSITDMNNDGKEEVFVNFGNSFTSGETGSSIVLFIKNEAGVFQKNLGFPAMAELLPTANKGYPDIAIGGPGFSFPVWRWNGKEYVSNKTISDAQLGKLKTKSPEEAGKEYLAKMK